LENTGHVRPFPEITQVVLATFTALATPYSAKVRVPVAPSPAKYIVSVVIAISRSFADKLIKVTTVPTAYATLEFAGIVKSLSFASEAGCKMVLPESANTKV